MSIMYSSECAEYRKTHPNCMGCPYEPECKERVTEMLEFAKRLLNRLALCSKEEPLE